MEVNWEKDRQRTYKRNSRVRVIYVAVQKEDVF